MKITILHPDRMFVFENSHFKDWDIIIDTCEETYKLYEFYRGFIRNHEEFWFWADVIQTEEIIWVTNNPDYELVEQLSSTNMPKEWKIQMLRSVSEEVCYRRDNGEIWEQTGNKIADNMLEV